MRETAPKPASKMQVPPPPEGFSEGERENLVRMAATDLFTARPDIAKSLMLVPQLHDKLQTELKLAYNLAVKSEKDQEKVLAMLKSTAMEIGKRLTKV